MEGAGKRKRYGSGLIDIYCTSCHKKLFSVGWEASGIISIKCDRCKSVLAVTLRQRAEVYVKAADRNRNVVSERPCMAARHKTDVSPRMLV